MTIPLDQVFKEFLDYGMLGTVVVLLVFAYMQLQKDGKETKQEHKKERDVWRQQAKEQFEKMTEVVEKNTAAFISLKSTLDSIDKRVK